MPTPRPYSLPALQSYYGILVAHYAPMLGLGGWDIRIIAGAPLAGESPDVDATTEWDTQQRVATIRFAPDAEVFEGLEDRILVVHELLHIALADAERAWSITADGVHTATRAVVDGVWEEAVERTVYRMSASLAAALPAPPPISPPRHVPATGEVLDAILRQTPVLRSYDWPSVDSGRGTIERRESGSPPGGQAS